MAGICDTRSGVVVRAYKRRIVASVHCENGPVSIPKPINRTAALAFGRVDLVLHGGGVIGR